MPRCHEVVGMPAGDSGALRAAAHEDDRPDLQRRLAAALRRTQQPEQVQIGCRTGDGRQSDLAVVVSVIRDPEGRAMNVLLVFHDITEVRRLAVQLRHGEKMQAVGLLMGPMPHRCSTA